MDSRDVIRDNVVETDISTFNSQIIFTVIAAQILTESIAMKDK